MTPVTVLVRASRVSVKAKPLSDLEKPTNIYLKPSTTFMKFYIKALIVSIKLLRFL